MNTDSSLNTVLSDSFLPFNFVKWAHFATVVGYSAVVFETVQTWRWLFEFSFNYINLLSILPNDLMWLAIWICWQIFKGIQRFMRLRKINIYALAHHISPSF